MSAEAPPKPGWYAKLEGEDFDLEGWRLLLKEPFDPVAIKLAGGATVLWSKDFEGLADASEVRERALVLIGRLNGALRLWDDVRPVRFAGILRIDEEGRQHAYLFAELAEEFGVCVMRATAVVLGPDGKPVPPPPPQPSAPQNWNAVASENDAVSDLLDHFGRADNWYDIYKTIELAEALVGGERALLKTVDSGSAAKELKRSANFYRHARAERPPRLFTLAEAKPVLAAVVRSVLTALSDRAPSESAAE